MNRLSVGFVSLGCPKNLVDTENMISALSNKGFSITGNESEADVIVVNTCGFLEPAKQESMSTIGEFLERKKSGDLKALVVAGCMTERYLKPMQEAFPEVDAFVRTGQFSQIVPIVEELSEKEKISSRWRLTGEASAQLQGHSEIHDFVKRLESKRPYAYVKISEGCNRTCSFCIIPKLRGKHHSRSIEGIVDEIQQLVSAGTKEIILIAQDLTSYGRDLKNGTSLLKLLEAVEEISDLKWYRLLYNYPRFFDDELIQFLASSQRFSGYLDIPFQHSSDAVLKMMKRPETGEQIRDLISKLRENLPELSLRTTLMVGFPGESDSDFQNLLEFVEASEFDHMGAFTYFREKDTPSFDLDNQVPDETKQARLDELMHLQSIIQQKKLSKKVGKTLDVMIDALAEKTKSGLLYRARHAGQAPEIDGLTYVLSKAPLTIGEIYPARINKVLGHYDLSAEL
ncbi:MAG: 30S ribosomal protein S12 methylthiotransferase RimO [Bdellovibrionota bacterium]